MRKPHMGNFTATKTFFCYASLINLANKLVEVHFFTRLLRNLAELCRFNFFNFANDLAKVDNSAIEHN